MNYWVSFNILDFPGKKKGKYLYVSKDILHTDKKKMNERDNLQKTKASMRALVSRRTVAGSPRCIE